MGLPAFSGDGDGPHSILHDAARRSLLTGEALGDHPVAQHRHGQPLHVVRDHVAAARCQRQSLGCAHQGQHPPGAHAQLGPFLLSCALAQRGNIPAQIGRYLALGKGSLSGLQLLAGADRLQVPQGFRGNEPVQDPHSLLRVGIARGQPHEKTVQLRFRQGKGALDLDGVLGGHHQEGLRQGIGHAAFSHLPLLHALQQRALGARRSTVDLVRQQNMGEHRARMKDELCLILPEDAGARDIGRQQIRGELDAGECAADGAGEAACQHCFARAGHILQQHVAAGEHGGEHQIDYIAFPYDHAGDVLFQSPGEGLNIGRLHGGPPFFLWMDL